MSSKQIKDEFEYNLNARIYSLMISGVLITDFLENYKELVQYMKTEKFIELNEMFGMIDEFIDEIERFIKAIEEGKTEVLDDWDRKIQIINKGFLVENDRVYLVKEPNKLFYLSTNLGEGELIETLGDTMLKDTIKCKNINIHVKDFFLEEDDVSVVLKGEKLNKMLYPNRACLLQGPVIFSGRDDNSYKNNGNCNISLSDLMEILSNQICLGVVSIPIDKFL